LGDADGDDRLELLREDDVALERKQRKDIAETIAAGRHLITIAGVVKCPRTLYTDVNGLFCKIWVPSLARRA
jgi:hypothetical protein